MAAVYLLIGVAILFIVIGLFLFCGKGSWLIAGYNTASKADKDKYDKNKLCKATSVICFIMAVLTFAMAFFGYRVETGLMPENSMLIFACVYIAVIIVSIVWYMNYINKRCKK